MRVRYTGGPDSGSPGSGDLVSDRTYSVLEISTLFGGESYFRIEISVGEPPALFDVRLFVQESSAIPENWAVTLGADGLLTIGPKAWRKAGFWDAILDREEWALKIFDEERARVLKGDGGLP